MTTEKAAETREGCCKAEEALARVRRLSATLRREYGDIGEDYADAIDLAIGGELESLEAALSAARASEAKP